MVIFAFCQISLESFQVSMTLKDSKVLSCSVCIEKGGEDRVIGERERERERKGVRGRERERERERVTQLKQKISIRFFSANPAAIEFDNISKEL